MDAPQVQVQVAGELQVKMTNAIIVFQKNEELGNVKTRLAASIGDIAALEAYKKLIFFTHSILKGSPFKKVLFFSSFIPKDLSHYQNDYSFELQSEGDLGVKMKDAFKRLFDSGYEKLLIVGTDCAELTSEIIEKAFVQLDHKELVIGPADDGGYYLLGMKKFVAGVFDDIPWSTDRVTELTKEYLNKNGLSFSLLPSLSDIDDEEDWERFKFKI